MGISWLGTAWNHARAIYGEARRKGRGDWRLLAGFIIMDGKKIRMPADFLLGPDPRIRSARYGRASGDVMLFSELDQSLRSPRLWY